MSTQKPMSKLFSAYKTDRTLEEDGVWMPVVDGIRFKIRRAKSRAAAAVLQDLQKEYADALREKVVSEEVQTAIYLRHLAWGIVADWEGVEHHETGEVVPYSRDYALVVLTELTDLRDEIANVSSSRDAFKQKNDEAALGN